MKILLIDNHTDYLHNFGPLFLEHDVEIQQYRPGLNFHDAGKDLVILSGGGGEGYELPDTHRDGKLWYEDEMNFVLTCDKPLVGVCMGFEVISAAFGADVNYVGKYISGFKTQQTSKLGQKRLKLEKLRQYEYHQFAVPKVSAKQFEVLAESPTGIELIKHRTKKIIASQFHPEHPGGTLDFAQLLAV